MTTGRYASSAEPLTWRGAWRSARPGLILLAAILLAVLGMLPGTRLVAGLVVGGVLVLMGVIVLVGRRRLAEHPRRIGRVAEFEIATVVCFVVACLAVAVHAGAWAVEHFQQKAPAYVAGLVAGAVVGYFSRDLLKASDNEDWFAAHYRALTLRLYRPYFYRRGTGGRYGGDAALARWKPDELAANALRLNKYRNEDGVTVSGWNRAARAQRAATFDAELKKVPWNPNPNGDPEATAISGA